ncbi:hypothetical protein BGZ94_002496, partial [Podila epigama]
MPTSTTKHTTPSPVQPTMNNEIPSTATHASTETGAPSRKLRVAVVGSGLAGLTVAHLLSSLHMDNGHGEQGIDVELFEKAHKL